MYIVTLASKTGWHTDELDRAVRQQGHQHQLARYEDLAGSFGSRRGLRSGSVELERDDVVLARIIPSGSLEQIIHRVDDGKTYVLDVNGIPGWEGLQRATGLDVAGAIVEHAVKHALPRKRFAP